MRVGLRHRQHHLVVDLRAEGDGYRAVVNDVAHVVTARSLGDHQLLLTIDGQPYRVDLARRRTERLVAVGGEQYTFVPESGAAGHQVATVAPPEILAPMPGKVLEVLVQPGDRVAAGDGLLILEAMKMESRLLAEASGTVAEVRVTAGDTVDGGQVLLVLRYAE